MVAAVNRKGERTALLHERLKVIQRQIHNCTDAIAEGKRYPSLMEKLAELEQELADTKAKIAFSAPGEAKLLMRDTRRFVEARLANLQSMLVGQPRIARAEIAKHVANLRRIWDLEFARDCGCLQWCRGPGMHDTATG